MATSVDTNVLSYLLLDSDKALADAAEQALANAAAEGIVAVCGPVFAELLAIGVWDATGLAAELSKSHIEVDDRFSRDAWVEAANAFAHYLDARRPAEYLCPTCGTRQRFRCRSCGSELGRPKHVLTDFLIGAHAKHFAYALLTHDTGVYESFFPQLRLLRLSPAAGAGQA